MFRILAIVSLAVAVVLYFFALSHERFTWTLLLLLGLLFLAIDGWSPPRP